MRRIVTMALFGMLWCGLARGADSFDESRPIPSGGATRSAKATDTGKPREKRAATSWVTTLSSLAVVLALVYLTAKVLRKGLPATQQSLPAEVLQVLGRRALDSRNAMHLVRCGSRLLIVGSSQAGLSPLGEITDPVEVDYLAGLCRATDTASVAESFQQLFRRFQGAEPASGAHADGNGAAVDPALTRLHTRLTPLGGGGMSRSSDDHFEEVV